MRSGVPPAVRRDSDAPPMRDPVSFGAAATGVPGLQRTAEPALGLREARTRGRCAALGTRVCSQCHPPHPAHNVPIGSWVPSQRANTSQATAVLTTAPPIATAQPCGSIVLNSTISSSALISGKPSVGMSQA
jgi:hypothetical protein